MQDSKLKSEKGDSPKKPSTNQLMKKTVAAMGNKKSGIDLVASAMGLKSATSSKSRSMTKIVKDAKNVRVEAMKLAATAKFKQLSSGAVTRCSSSDEEEPPSDRDKVLRHDLSWLDLKRKRSSVMFREIGLRHIRVIPATPEIYNVRVKKQKTGGTSRMYGVMIPADADATVIPPVFKGPRYRETGEIIPHSILGETNSCLQPASTYQGVHGVGRMSQVGTTKPVTVYSHQQHRDGLLAEDKPLKQWDTEMAIRNQKQKLLAEKLKRREGDLLMCRSDVYSDKKCTHRLLEHEDRTYHPDVCFWRQEECLGCQQILPTFTRSERGSQPTPMVSGEADMIIAEKGKSACPQNKPGSWMNAPYLKDTLAKSGGVMRVVNNVVFNDLAVHGDPVVMYDQSNNGESPDVDKGGYPVDQDMVKVDNSQELLSQVEDGVNPGHGTKGTFDPVEALLKRWEDVEEKKISVQGPAIYVGGKILRWIGDHDKMVLSCIVNQQSSVAKDVTFSDTVAKHCNHSNQPNLNFSENCSICMQCETKQCSCDGPSHEQKCIGMSGFHGKENGHHMSNISENVSQNSSSIIDRRLGCQSNRVSYSDTMPSNKDSSCHSNIVAMETTVTVEGEVGKVMKCHAVFQNVGTTVIRYSWMKVKEEIKLPIHRLFKRTFYFHDDNGVLLPNEKCYVPMIFRSTLPGNYSQTWLLRTEPVLEGGAHIKFVFRGVARQNVDYGPQIRDIESYLERKCVQTICAEEAGALLDYAILKASLRADSLREDPILLTMEEQFELANTGMYYHAHVVKRLQILFESVSMEKECMVAKETEDAVAKETDVVVKERPVPSLTVNGVHPGEATHREQETTLHVSKLRQALLLLPEEEDDDDEGCTNHTRKQSLLWQLYKDVGVLSFSPLSSFTSEYQNKCSIVYSMLQSGVDRVVNQAMYLAEKFDLVIKEVEDVKSMDKLEPAVTKKTTGKPKPTAKSRQKVTKSAKGGKGKVISPTESVAPVASVINTPDQTSHVEVFSNVHKFRLTKEAAESQQLRMYDEKVHLEMYGMLLETVYNMVDLFENV